MDDDEEHIARGQIRIPEWVAITAPISVVLALGAGVWFFPRAMLGLGLVIALIGCVLFVTGFRVHMSFRRERGD